MTDQNKTLIAALLDRSGSMQTSKEATEEGFNALMKTQAKEPGQALVTLAQFDSYGGGGFHVHPRPAIWGEPHTPSGYSGYKPEFVYRMQDITSVPRLNVQPRGGTPLIDCLGEFIEEIGRDLAKMREQDRPGAVIIVVMTDGEENSSRAWTASMLKNKIAEQEGTWKWKFVFLGANIDAVGTGASYGISRGASMTYDDASPVAVANAFNATSGLISATRSAYAAGDVVAAASIGYTDEDREEAVEK